jgi:hypothetical protein
MSRCVRLLMWAMVLGPVVGCGMWSDNNKAAYADAAGELAVYALSCSVFQCPESLREYAVVRGRVLERGPLNTLAVENARVVLQQSGREIAIATTDRAGRFAGEVQDLRRTDERPARRANGRRDDRRGRKPHAHALARRSRGRR